MSCQVNLLFLPYHNTGAHFIDWSIRYVCGQNNSATVSDSINWHSNHKSIITRGFKHTVEKIKDLQQSSTNVFENIYIRMLRISDILKTNFNVDYSSATQNQLEQSRQYAINDLVELFTWAQQQNMMPIMFDYQDEDLLNIFYNDRFPGTQEGKHTDKHAAINNYIECFFKESKEKFNSDTISDQRELIAMSYKFKNLKLKFDNCFINNHPHLYYNTDDIWNDFPNVLNEICSIRHLPISTTRLISWNNIYNNWRRVHEPAFSRNIDRIIDSIVNNKYMSLERFNMDFFKEVVIQHYLIYKHNLNLKTWNLDQFPNNTQELHKLLEPNIHHHV